MQRKLTLSLVTALLIVASLSMHHGAFGSMLAQVFSGPGLEGGVGEAAGIQGPVTTDLQTFILNALSYVFAFLELMGIVAITVAGLYLVLGFGSETAKDRAKKIVIYTAVGLLLILFAKLIVDFILSLGGQGSADITGPILSLLNTAVAYLAIAATVAITVAGFYLILGFGSEAAKDKAKKIVIYTIIGMLLVLFATFIVNFILSLGGQGVADVRGVVLGLLNTAVSYLAIAATIAITVAGFYLILGFGSEGAKDKAKKIVLYTIIGMLLVLFATFIVNFVLSLGGQGVVDVRGVILGLLNTAVSYLALLATIAIVVAGFYLVLGFGSESAKDTAKKIIIYTIVGILIVMFATVIVNFVLSLGGQGTGVNVYAIINNLLIMVVNYLALIATIAIVVAGIYLVASFGNEPAKDKAKKIILYTIIGLLVVLFARVIVGFFTKGFPR